MVRPDSIESSRPQQPSRRPTLDLRRARDLMLSTWQGDAPFRELAHEMATYLREASAMGAELLKAAEWHAERPEELDLPSEGWDPQLVDDVDGELAMILSRTVRGEALTIVRNCSVGRGLQAWLQLVQRYQPGSSGDAAIAMAKFLVSRRCASMDELLKRLP